ncbi:duboraya, partial [Centroberyx affinis]|uniref:duboraya n=1 Tax=Centroberyx affinis TaxID=166261 RepID=UPI003A5C75EF
DRWWSPDPMLRTAAVENAKPVRRRPPRSLQLPKPQGDDQEKAPGALSPLPVKVKRNSALIEKLHANLALSPSALLPSPKSPGLRLLPPSFIPPSPCNPVTTVTPTVTPTSPVSAAASHRSEEEGPASFEAPPTATEGSILPSVNKGRARLSIRRRPPSRRNRKSSSGDDVGVATGEKDTPLSSPGDPEAKTAGEEEEGKDGEVFNKEVNAEEVKKEETEPDSACPEGETEVKTEREEPQEPEAPSEGGREEEKNQEDKENGPTGKEEEEEKEEEEGAGPAGRENQEEPVRNQEEELEETSGEEGNTDSKEEDERKQTQGQSSDG